MDTTLEIGLLLASLLFYADYDSSFDAVFSKGCGSAMVIEDRYPPRLTTGNGGRYGEAAEFDYGDLDLDTVWTKDVLRYLAEGNFPYQNDAPYDGTVGMWIQVDMDALMKRQLIWLDPFHLLPEDRTVSRDSGKIWMDIVTKELPDTPILRFGATLPKEHRTNPDNSGEGNIVIVPNIDFRKGEWHHIIGTWKNINGTKGTAAFAVYIDGNEAGRIDNATHPIQWNIEDWELRIGLAFKGRIDEFFVLDKYIDEHEARELFRADMPLGNILELDDTRNNGNDRRQHK